MQNAERTDPPPSSFCTLTSAFCIPPRYKKALKVVLRITILVYLGLAIMLAGCQTYLIFPGAASQGRRDAIVRPFAGSELVEMKSASGEKITGLFGAAQSSDGSPHPDAVHRPTIVYFYGNGMCMADCAGEFLKLRRRGFNVMLADYLGYGMSAGKPSEAGVFATADACFNHLESRSDIDKTRIVPMGWSLGAAAAIHLASTRPVPCLVTVSAFTSMGDMAHKIFPIIPARLFLRHRFENEQKLKLIKVPIFLAHGTRDSIIPFEMSKRLAKAAAGPVTKFDVPDGDHNNVFDIGGVELMNAIEQFINAHAGR